MEINNCHAYWFRENRRRERCALAKKARRPDCTVRHAAMIPAYLERRGTTLPVAALCGDSLIPQCRFQMPTLRSPEDILTTELKEIYSAERQLSRAIPRFVKKISSDRLRQMLEQRVQQGAALIDQLDEALEEMEVPKARPKNIAAEGLLEDVSQHLDEVEDDRLIDPLLLASVQKIEHYCIASWGTAAAIGRLLDEDKVVKAMERVLDEGKRFDEELTKLAAEEINPQMLEGEEEEEDEEEEEGEEEEGEEAEDEESEDEGHEETEEGETRTRRTSRKKSR
jgi:ferritin-like metal-binding protein YciE